LPSLFLPLPSPFFRDLTRRTRAPSAFTAALSCFPLLPFLFFFARGDSKRSMCHRTCPFFFPFPFFRRSTSKACRLSTSLFSLKEMFLQRPRPLLRERWRGRLPSFILSGRKEIWMSRARPLFFFLAMDEDGGTTARP